MSYHVTSYSRVTVHSVQVSFPKGSLYHASYYKIGQHKYIRINSKFQCSHDVLSTSIYMSSIIIVTSCNLYHARHEIESHGNPSAWVGREVLAAQRAIVD